MSKKQKKKIKKLKKKIKKLENKKISVNLLDLALTALTEILVGIILYLINRL